MKKVSTILCILLIFILIFTLSACKDYGYDTQTTYNGMKFWFVPEKSENGKDYYYIAGNLENKTVKNYFMPMFVNGLPVRSFGWTGMVTPIYMNLYNFALQKLYMPGTIIKQSSGYRYIDSIHQDMQIYYCGEVIDLYKIYPYESESHKIDYYVPAEKLDDFANIYGTTTTIKPDNILVFKANISYRLNSEDMCEYYYVDNIESGSKIQNIPPEPTRAGYTFGGWYTEKECTIKWDFDNVPTVSNNDDSFVEFALYAKWTKN